MNNTSAFVGAEVDLTPSLATLGLPPLQNGEGAARRASAERG